MWGLHCKVRGETWALLRLVEIDLEMAGVPDGPGMPGDARPTAVTQWESFFAGFVLFLSCLCCGIHFTLPESG